MATTEAQEELESLDTWDEKQVATWLGLQGFEQYVEAFTANHINGRVLPLLRKKDLKKLGVGSVGHRVKLMHALSELQQAHTIRHRTKVLLKWQHWRMAPWHPFNTRYFRLTPSAIEMHVDRWFCGESRESIDIAGITDVQLRGRGCFGCFYSTIVIESRGDPPVAFNIRVSQADKVCKTIRNTWEGHQAAVANRRMGGF
eukprot:g1728.t1